MKRSETIANLAKALAAAQGQFEAAKKDHIARVQSKKGEGSSYSYNYADLASVFESIREPLAKNGLSFTQFPSVDSSRSFVEITTILYHESGEFLEAEPLYMPVSADMNGAQAIGSAITFGRRYSISSILGIATELDDDANAACGQRAETGRVEPDPNAPKCPKCSSAMKKRDGKNGPFWGCTDYPKCKGIVNVGKEPPANDPPADEFPQQFIALRDTLYAMGVPKGNLEHANAVVKYAYDGATMGKCAKDGEFAQKVFDGLLNRTNGRSNEEVYHAALEAAGIKVEEGVVY